MMFSAGARLGPYEIVSPLGAGGMGEVYRARDTRLNRTIALKLLPSEYRDRPERQQRFQAEARAISSLNHPHICTLFDVGEHDGAPFFVMEYLEGETLDDRLTRGPLHAKELLLYASQIADALDHAHREGFVHRDLKPSNVMLTASGTKLLDFGLARPSPVQQVVRSTTVSLQPERLTAEGTIVGTFQYMAPEQLEGKDTDARTDIFAFGTLLFEMATGRRAFDGESQASLIASILTQQPPPVSSARKDTGLPPALDHVVERCLAKSPSERWQTVRDVKLELDWIASGSLQSTRAPVALLRRRRDVLAWAIAFVALVVAVAIATGMFRRPPQPAELSQFLVTPPTGSVLAVLENSTRIAVSPDGRHLAYTATTDGREQLFVRSFESTTARPLGTDEAMSPFWSPDSRFVGYFAPQASELKKIEITGGPARTICSAPLFQGTATWGRDGSVLLTQLGKGVLRCSAEGGGTPVPVTKLDEAQRERNHFYPEFLPDGRHFLYVATALDERGRRPTPVVYVASLDSPERTRLPQIHSRAAYSPPGYLLFVQEGALMAQSFDATALALRGEPVSIAESVAYYRTLGTSGFSVSSNGVLAYHGAGEVFRLVWYDRQGEITEPDWPAQPYGAMRISRDGRRIAVDVIDPRVGPADIWIYDVSRGTPIRLTTDIDDESSPVWSPDEKQILFRSQRIGAPSLYVKSFADGVEEPVFPGASPLNSLPISPSDWSLDGRWLAYISNSPVTDRDVWIVPRTGEPKPQPIARSRFDEYDGQFSPDSAWIAFVSSESGRPEIYVAPVARPGDKRPVSSGGGTTPRWRKDGRELFYASLGNQSIMAVPIKLGATVIAGAPQRLFSLGGDRATRPSPRNAVYDVTPDGQRFLISAPAGEPVSSRITVAMNWTAGLKK
jgi:serine/threonine protein kinase